MIYSKPFSTLVDKFVKPTKHDRGLWAISVVFFFLKKMKALWLEAMESG